MSLPTDAKDRKRVPLASGVLDYFPDALAEIAHTSWVGNEQHNPGTPLHWDRTKSTDEADALMRHFMERGKTDVDGLRHSAKMAWRALALLQKEIEAERKRDDLTAKAVREMAPCDPQPFFWTHEDDEGTRYYSRPTKRGVQTVYDEDGNEPT